VEDMSFVQKRILLGIASWVILDHKYYTAKRQFTLAVA